MTTKIPKILAFVQPGEKGAVVLKEALYYMQILKVRLVVLNIVKPLSFTDKIFYKKNQEPDVEFTKQELTGFVNRFTNHELHKNITLLVKTGNIDSCLIEESNTGEYEFAVIEKTGCSDKISECRRIVDKIVSESKCPVLIVGEQPCISKIKNIVIPIDISQSTKKRLLWASLFAKKFNAKITVLSAINTSIKIKNSLAYRNANKIKHLMWQQNIDCEIQVLPVFEQEKYELILNYLKQEKPGLVIIRTHQEPFALLPGIGKFVSQIIHESKTSVFSVNYTPDPLKSFFL